MTTFAISTIWLGIMLGFLLGAGFVIILSLYMVSKKKK